MYSEIKGFSKENETVTILKMSKEVNNFEKIDAYLLGELRPDEQLNFVAAMKKDIKLQEEVNLRRAIMEGVKIEGRKRLSNTLDEIHDKKDRTLSNANPTIQKTLRPWLAVAAALALILTCWFIFQTPQKDSLVAHYYEPYDLTIGLRDNSNQEQLARIDALYSAQNYSAAQPLIENYLSNNPSDNLLRLSLAICQYENENLDKALQSLQLIKNDAFLQDQYRWYSALIYLDKGEKEQARRLLTELTSDRAADHFDEAQVLLSKMQ